MICLMFRSEGNMELEVSIEGETQMSGGEEEKERHRRQEGRKRNAPFCLLVCLCQRTDLSPSVSVPKD